MMPEADLQTIKNKAVDFLSRREHSEQELRDKLLAKRFDANLVEQAIDAMLDAGYLSDARYVRMMIRSGFEKAHGPQKIRFKLQQKRVPSPIVNEAFEEFEGDWFASAQSLKQRKFPDPLNRDDRETYYKERARQMRFLAGRGFTMDQIEYALENTEN
jgi:regulatory protein